MRQQQIGRSEVPEPACQGQCFCWANGVECSRVTASSRERLCLVAHLWPAGDEFEPALTAPESANPDLVDLGRWPGWMWPSPARAAMVIPHMVRIMVPPRARDGLGSGALENAFQEGRPAGYGVAVVWPNDPGSLLTGARGRRMCWSLVE